MPDVLRPILEAHGGVDYWRSLSAIDVEFSAWGFLFTAKHVAPQQHTRLTVNTRIPEAVLHDYPAVGQHAVVHAGRVDICDTAGSVLDSRVNPREAFRSGRALRWNAIDFAYFCGYAMWNYLTLPFLLLTAGVAVETSAKTAPSGGTRLIVRYPPGVPTHSPTQELTFDAGGRLLRHDYTAEVVGAWAKAAHLCRDYRQFGGLWLPTTRRVYPRGPFGRPLPAPTLVAIDIHDAHPR